MLLKAGKKEPNGLARCIALSSLGTFVYRELVHQTYHPKLKDAIIVLLAALKFNNKAVAQVINDPLVNIFLYNFPYQCSLKFVRKRKGSKSFNIFKIIYPVINF